MSHSADVRLWLPQLKPDSQAIENDPRYTPTIPDIPGILAEWPVLTHTGPSDELHKFVGRTKKRCRQ